MDGSSPGPSGPTVPPDINLYNNTNPGPFIVFVQPYNNEEAKVPAKLHPITFGKFLASHKVGGIKHINKKGRERLGITFNSYDNANHFVQHKVINTAFNCFIPKHLTSTQGVIRQVDPSLSIDEIINNIHSSCKVISARRLNRRVFVAESNTNSYMPTQSVVLTFAGRFLPRTVGLYYVSLDVKPYILPVLRCYNCLRFGHTAKLCKSKLRCPICTNEHKKEECNQTSGACIHCSGPHSALDPTCPELKRQQRIKQIMATERLSFAEAASLMPKNTQVNTTEDKTTNNLISPQSFPAIRSIFDDINLDKQVRTASTSSYSSAIKNKKRKPNSSYMTQGYDRVAHNNMLFSPNGHLPKSINEKEVTENVHFKNIDHEDISTLKKLLDGSPQGKIILNLVYSILLQATTDNSFPTHVENPPMELS